MYEALKPGRNPLDELARVASSLVGALNAGEDIRTKGSNDATILQQWAEVALKDQRDRRAVIFVDQFEEAFTQVAKEETRIAFLNLLTYAATVDSGRVIILFAMRSDFVSNCAMYPQLNALLSQQFLQIGAMQPDELVSAIAQPALRVGLQIDPALIAQIINEMEGEPGALPLMQFALKDLFDAQQAKRGVSVLTLPDYLARGGIHKALERHADTAFAQFSAAEQQITREVFGGLIQVGRGTQDTRRTALFAELVSAGSDRARVESVVQKLANARLITTDETDGQDTVTISHEKLIDAWPWLRKLVNENRDAIALQNQIAEDAGEWDQQQRDASYLYTGARLANAQEQLTAKQIVLNGTAQAFVAAGVAASEATRRREAERTQKELDDARRLAEETEGRRRAEAERRQDAEGAALRLKTRNRLITAVGVAALVLAILAGVFGVQSSQNAATAERNAVAAQAASTKAVSEAHIRATAESSANLQRDEAQRQARLALSRQLAAQAAAQRENHFDLALLLGVQSQMTTATTEAQSSLLGGLMHNPLLTSFLRGHGTSVQTLAFSPNSQILVSGDHDGTIVLWDVSNPIVPAQLGAPLTDRTTGVQHVALSPDGRLLASADAHGAINLWDVSNPKAPVLLGMQLAGDAESVLNFGLDSKSMASANLTGTITLWDISNPTKPVRTSQATLEHEGAFSSISFSPDGQLLASGDNAGTITLWDVSNLEAPVPYSTPLSAGTRVGDITMAVNRLVFSSNGQLLASTDSADKIIVWNVSDPRAPVQLSVPFSEAYGISSMAFSPDSQTLATGSCVDYDHVNLQCVNGQVVLWDISDATTPVQLDRPLRVDPDQVLEVAFSPDGKTLASAGADKLIALWNVANLKDTVPLGHTMSGSTKRPYSAALSSDGQLLASDSDENGIILWDISDQAAPIQLSTSLPISHTAIIRDLAFSPDRKTLAAAYDDGTLLLWDVSDPAKPNQRATLSACESGAAYSIDWSPRNPVLVSGCRNATLVVWDVSDPGQPLRLNTLTDHAGAVISVAFSPDGKRLASGSWDDTMILWDVSDPATPIRLSQIHSGHADAISSLAFSPQGNVLAASSWDKTISLWDVSNPKNPVQLGAPLSGHASLIWSVAYSPNSKWLASGSSDQTIGLWEVSNPQAPALLGLLPLTGFSKQVRTTDFSSDGKTLAAIGSTITVLDVDPVSWQARACRIASRNFTRAEWQQYMGNEPYRKTCEQWPLEPEATPAP